MSTPTGFTPPDQATVDAIASLNAGLIGSCIGCGQTDDHPHHRIDVGGGQEVVWHNDCHARATPACPVCKAVTDSHGGTLTGDALRAHIAANDPAGQVAEQLNDANATEAR